MNAVKEQVNGTTVAVTTHGPAKEVKKPSDRHPRPRLGKSARDRANNAKNKNAENKDARASWQNDPKFGAFPVSACNGKRNRYQVTGKGNQTVYLKERRK